MKKHLLVLLLSMISLTLSAQRITLAIRQNYNIPDQPKITQNGDTLKSSSPIGNQWFKDGVELVGENKQTIVMKNSGVYKVSVTLGSGCSTESTTYSAIKTDVPIIKASDFKCLVYPNPSSGVFTVELQSDKAGEYCFELLDSSGKSVLKSTFEHQEGIQRIPFGRHKLINGVYFLEVKFGINYISHKIIITH